MVIVAFILPFQKLQFGLSHVVSVWTSCVILIKLIYQMKFVKESDLQTNCTIELNAEHEEAHFMVNSTAWAGLHKANVLFNYLQVKRKQIFFHLIYMNY